MVAGPVIRISASCDTPTDGWLGPLFTIPECEFLRDNYIPIRVWSE
jgi:hypothetical protein